MGGRSQFCLEAIQAQLNPPAPEGEMGDLLERLEILEAITDQFVANKGKPTELDAAIDKTLMQLRPNQRAEARKLFNRLKSATSAS